MTAPELIWAVQADANGLVRRWDEHYIGGHRYILTDLHDATKVQLAECEARLRKAVEALRVIKHTALPIYGVHDMDAKTIRDVWAVARAALAEIEKGGV